MILSPPGLSYRLITFLLLPLWLVHALWHGHKHGLEDYFKLRVWGNKNKSKPAVVWVHAASVGEVEAVTPLVRILQEQAESVLFTCFTATGYRTVERNFADQVEADIIPIDLTWNCRRFVRQHNIKLCLLMETELWPELLYQTASKGIPIIQLNARLSHKTLESPRLIRRLLRHSMSYISLHLTRNNIDRECLMQLGAAEEKIKIVGNLKSTIDLSPDNEKLIERDYLLLASSHDNEEKLLLSLVPADFENLLLVIAPRHPNRSKEIQHLLSQQGFNYSTRSRSETITAETQVYLADTLGELKSFMAHAQIVIMGGSFDQTGGHNLIEPAALGCALITGPSDSNIRDDIALLGDGIGILQVADVAECWNKVTLLLENPDQRKQLGQQALQAVRSQANVLEAYLTEIKTFL